MSDFTMKHREKTNEQKVNKNTNTKTLNKNHNMDKKTHKCEEKTILLSKTMKKPSQTP